MNFLTIFIFCFLGAALAAGIVELFRMNRPNEQEKTETEVIENGLEKKEADESRNN